MHVHLHFTGRYLLVCQRKRLKYYHCDDFFISNELISNACTKKAMDLFLISRILLHVPHISITFQILLLFHFLWEFLCMVNKMMVALSISYFIISINFRAPKKVLFLLKRIPMEIFLCRSLTNGCFILFLDEIDGKHRRRRRRRRD